MFLCQLSISKVGRLSPRFDNGQPVWWSDGTGVTQYPGGNYLDLANINHYSTHWRCWSNTRGDNETSIRGKIYRQFPGHCRAFVVLEFLWGSKFTFDVRDCHTVFTIYIQTKLQNSCFFRFNFIYGKKQKNLKSINFWHLFNYFKSLYCFFLFLSYWLFLRLEMQSRLHDYQTNLCSKVRMTSFWCKI